jgi:hypothetical protein
MTFVKHRIINPKNLKSKKIRFHPKINGFLLLRIFLGPESNKLFYLLKNTKLELDNSFFKTSTWSTLVQTYP